MQLRLTTMPSEGGETGREGGGTGGREEGREEGGRDGREGEMGSCKVDQGCNVHVHVVVRDRHGTSMPLCENFQGVSIVILNLGRARENVQD